MRIPNDMMSKTHFKYKIIGYEFVVFHQNSLPQYLYLMTLEGVDAWTTITDCASHLSSNYKRAQYCYTSM